MLPNENFSTKYFKSIILLIALVGITLFSSCGSECYETSEPEVYINIFNNCKYKTIEADGLIKPIEIKNDCTENLGTVTITLPLLENEKTYKLTDGFNTIDSFTFIYELGEDFQSDCGYVVRLQRIEIDSAKSSIPFIYEINETPNDSLQPYCGYTTFADYMQLYY